MDTPKKTTRKKPIEHDGLLDALLKFQSEVPVLYQNTKGYGYTYVDLAEIMRVTTPLLAKHNLGVMQPLEVKGIKTILYHTKTKETIESYCEIPQDVNLKGMNPFQAYGSAITYFRRYSLSSLLGLVSDKDIDASGESQKAKRKLTNDEVKQAIMSIENGSYTREELETNFDLTNSQKSMLS